MGGQKGHFFLFSETTETLQEALEEQYQSNGTLKRGCHFSWFGPEKYRG